MDEYLGFVPPRKSVSISLDSRSSTAILVSSGDPWLPSTNKTCSPPGSACGQAVANVRSVSASHSSAGRMASPATEPRYRPPLTLIDWITVSLVLHVKPRLVTVGVDDWTATGTPPSRDTFLSVFSVINPIQSPSGEKKGDAASSVPAITWASDSARSRM